MAQAVSLFSGSLASILATQLVMAAPGVREVKLLHFRSPFFRDYEATKEIARALWEAPFRSQSVKRDFRELSNINGSYKLRNCCLGCRRLMLQKGLRYMRKVGADFLVTGEIAGARGLSGEDMVGITAQIQDGDRVLRPLSAKLLPPTLPERQGWVDRERLYALTADRDGTQTQTQALEALAQKLRVDAGRNFPAERRCKLTLPRFGERLEDLLREESFSMNSLELLEFPLYYKKPPDVKIVLGRDDEEKRRLQNFFLPSDIRLYVPTHNGPMTLVRANWAAKSEGEIASIIELAARITVTHSDARRLARVQANYRFERSHETYRINVSPFHSQEELERCCLRLG